MVDHIATAENMLVQPLLRFFDVGKFGGDNY